MDLQHSALDRSVVDTVLSYLFPPSTSPIPSHLLSTPTRQRHHFLNLSPSDPAYFSWPAQTHSPEHTLDSLSQSTHSPESDWAAVVQYTANPDSIAAYVPLAPALHLVFLYEPQSSPPWKYHDTQPLPIPSNTHVSVTSAIAATRPRSEAEMDGSYDDNPDSYWAGYDSPRPATPSHKGRVEDTSEASYWAQYANIQGNSWFTPTTLNAHHRVN
jgi:hypothetical protein